MFSAFFGWIGPKVYAVVLFCIGALAIIARNRWLAKERQEEKERADRAEEFIKRNKEVQKLEEEIDAEYSDYKRETGLDTVPAILARPRRD